MPDPRDSTAKWQTENGTMCLRPLSLPTFLAGSKSSSHQARLWSADIQSVQCLSFVYSLGSPPPLLHKASFSVLLHSSGYETGAPK